MDQPPLNLPPELAQLCTLLKSLLAVKPQTSCSKLLSYDSCQYVADTACKVAEHLVALAAAASARKVQLRGLVYRRAFTRHQAVFSGALKDLVVVKGSRLRAREPVNDTDMTWCELELDLGVGPQQAQVRAKYKGFCDLGSFKGRQSDAHLTSSLSLCYQVPAPGAATSGAAPAAAPQPAASATAAGDSSGAGCSSGAGHGSASSSGFGSWFRSGPGARSGSEYGPGPGGGCESGSARSSCSSGTSACTSTSCATSSSSSSSPPCKLSSSPAAAGVPAAGKPATGAPAAAGAPAAGASAAGSEQLITSFFIAHEPGGAFLRLRFDPAAAAALLAASGMRAWVSAVAEQVPGAGGLITPPPIQQAMAEVEAWACGKVGEPPGWTKVLAADLMHYVHDVAAWVTRSKQAGLQAMEGRFQMDVSPTVSAINRYEKLHSSLKGWAWAQ